MNTDQYFEERCEHYKAQIQKELDDFSKGKEDWKEEHLIKEFTTHIQKIYDYTIDTLKIEENGETKFSHNRYLRNVSSKFREKRDDYLNNPIKNFLAFDLPELRKFYLKEYEQIGKEPSYAHKTYLLTENKTEDLLDWLAESITYLDTIKLYHSEQKGSNEKEIITKEEQRTTAQIVMSILIINDEYKFIKTTNKTEKVKFIYFLTGRNKRSIEDAIRLYERNKGAFHLTAEKNKDDLERVQRALKNLNNQSLNSILEAKIDKQKELITKSRESRTPSRT